MSHPRIIKKGDKLALDLGDEQHELESTGPSASVHRLQSRQQVPQIRAKSGASSSSTAAAEAAAAAEAKPAEAHGAAPRRMQEGIAAKRVNVRQAAIDSTSPTTTPPAARVGQSSEKKQSKFKQQMQANKADASGGGPSAASVLKGGIMERSSAAPVKHIQATTPAPAVAPLRQQQQQPKPIPMPAVRPQAAMPAVPKPQALQPASAPAAVEQQQQQQRTERPRVPEFDDVAQIREQNLQQVLQMSEADMKEAMDSIASLISPQMLEFLRSRQPSAEVAEAVQVRSAPQPTPPPEPIDLSSIQTEDELARAAATMLPETEKKKLAWTGMFEADEQAGQRHDAAPAMSQALQSERFDLHGKLLTGDAVGDVADSELFHHESKPDAPGYTLVELCELARSQVSSQRIIALRAMQGVLRTRSRAVLPEWYSNHTDERAASELPVELPATILYSFGERVAPQVTTEALLALSALLSCGWEDAEFDAVAIELQSYVSFARPPFIPNPQLSRKPRHDGKQTYEEAEAFALQRTKDLVRQANEPQDTDGVADAPPVHELLGLLSRHHLVEAIVFAGFLHALPSILLSTPLGMSAGSTLPARAAVAALSVIRSIAHASSAHAEHLAKEVILVVLKKSRQFFDLLSPSSSDTELKLPILQTFEAVVQSSRNGAMLLASNGLLEVLPAAILHGQISEGGVRIAALRLLRCFLAYGIGLPTVADMIELMKGNSPGIVGTRAHSPVMGLLAQLGFDVKFDDAATALEFLQVLEHAIPALAHGFAKLMDGKHKPGVAHKPVTFAVGDIRLHESVLQRLSGHVFGIAAALCAWLGRRLEDEQRGHDDDAVLRAVMNLLATVHASSSSAVDGSAAGSFLRVTELYASRFLRDFDFTASIQLFTTAWTTLKPTLGARICQPFDTLASGDQTSASFAEALVASRLLPLVYNADALKSPEAAEIRTRLLRWLNDALDNDRPVLTRLEEGVHTFVRRRVHRTTLIYVAFFLLCSGELSADDQIQLAFKLLRILGPGDEAFAVKLVEEVCFGPSLQFRLGSVPQQDLVHIRSLYSVAICDQDTLQHSQALALRLCFQLASQRCCPPETADASLLPLPAHWLLLPLTGSGTSAKMTNKVVVNVLRLLAMMQGARLQTYLELPPAAVIYSLMCAALALQEGEVSWSLEAHGMNEVVIPEDAETAASELMQQLLDHQLANLYATVGSSSESFAQEFREYIQQSSSSAGKKSVGSAPAGRRAAAVSTVLDFADELLARLLSAGGGGSEILPAVCGLLLLPQMHWTVQERALLEVGKAGQLDLLASPVLEMCVGAWLKPSRPIAAIDAILDAISASYTIGPARVSLIQNTPLYAMCLHAVAQAIDAAADTSTQSHTWRRLARLDDVPFAVDAVHYNSTVLHDVRAELQADQLHAASDGVKRIWQEHGLFPYSPRDDDAREKALQSIESRRR